jgi:tetratricopeptide (TPR) repeat protein
MPSQPFTTSKIDVDQLLAAGIAAVKAGESKQARKLLKKVVRLDQKNIQAWLWLSSVVDDVQRQQSCLEKILTIDPTHKPAQKGLRTLRKKQAGVETPQLKKLPQRKVKSPDLPRPAKDEGTAEKPARYKRLTESDLPSTDQSEPTANAPRRPRTASSKYKKLSPPELQETATPSETGLNGHRSDFSESPQPESVPAKPPQKLEAILNNEYLCPYCAAQTQYSDLKCDNCGQSLWQETLRHQETSGLYRFLLWSHIISNIIYISLALMLIRAAFDNNFLTASQAIGALCFFMPSILYFVVVLIILQRRMKIFFKVYLIQAVLFFGLSTAAAAGLGFSEIPNLIKIFGAGLAILSIGQFFMALNLGEDFTYDKHRILLVPGSEDGSGFGFMKRGKFFARKKMWALAAIHFQHAAYRLNKNIEPRLSLAVAYINLKKFDHAAESLAIAQTINPADYRLAKLEALVAKRSTAPTNP